MKMEIQQLEDIQSEKDLYERVITDHTNALLRGIEDGGHDEFDWRQEFCVGEHAWCMDAVQYLQKQDGWTLGLSVRLILGLDDRRMIDRFYDLLNSRGASDEAELEMLIHEIAGQALCQGVLVELLRRGLNPNKLRPFVSNSNTRSIPGEESLEPVPEDSQATPV
ncbi:MAG: hypothetical protein GC159_16275 [Phycisphaera sp.]|nr:hypothetical protein [Phycisphaera sp.]